MRALLNGRFENTAFCIFAPDGETRLSGTGRNPMVGLGVHRRPAVSTREQLAEDNKAVVKAMNAIATKHTNQAKPKDALLPDFHSFKQALNVSSGDQRILTYVVSSANEQKALKTKLKTVFNDPEILGKFHLDFSSESDTKWQEVLTGDKRGDGLILIQADEFGQKGQVLAALPLDSQPETIKSCLLYTSPSPRD